MDQGPEMAFNTPQTLLGASFPDAFDQFGKIAGLDEVIKRPEFHSFAGSGFRPMPRKDDNGHFGFHCLKYLQDLDAVHIFHLKVKDGEIERFIAQNANRLDSGQGGFHQKIALGRAFSPAL